MAEADVAESLPGERAHAGVALADHWILYTLVLALAVAVWFNVLYFIGVRFGMPGLAAFFR